MQMQCKVRLYLLYFYRCMGETVQAHLQLTFHAVAVFGIRNRLPPNVGTVNAS